MKSIYLATQDFPDDEKFGLTSQLRRCAVSIPSNIAEGHARSSSKDFARFLSQAMGSLAELETQLIIANELKLLAPETLEQLQQESAEIGRMMRGLRKSIIKRHEKSSQYTESQ